MLLSEPEVQKVVEKVKLAFPHFNDWEYNNEQNEYYSGFCVWGEFVIGYQDMMPRRFYVTFNKYEYKWRGNLTIGKHSYYWSSTEEGDADLLHTAPCDSLEQVIAELKKQMVELFRAFSAI
ncbi:hypothetical protein RIVM261_088700 [Rivularia sp. IAM M-261]|nr:hypothetical protein RIVM261_088700 [Rivularia sp. IAM M-261]